MTEVYLLFYQSILPVSNHFNQFLQREDPCIHLVHNCCEGLLKKLVVNFVKLSAIKTATTLAEVNTDIANRLSDDIFVGFVTRQTLVKLEREGDCSTSDSRKFLLSVQILCCSSGVYQV